MIAKVIVWDENRARCIDKMICTLKDSTVFGVYTNIPYLIEILNHEEFRSGKMTTRFIETHFADGLKSKVNDEQIKKWATEINKKIKIDRTIDTSIVQTLSPWTTYWRGV
jgi:3-methylcrotonyl-CoA carboxylase alpha subunit